MNNFEAHTKTEKNEMLEQIGCKNINELFSHVPEEVKIDGLNLAKPMSELEVTKEIKTLANKNKTGYISFLGGGAYNHFVPACVSQVAERFEFNTAYTPYQAEISQGTLQVIYEFQSMICSLTGLDTANASMYDAGTACAEAILMASRITGRKCAAVSERMNPEYINVIKTYAHAADIELTFFSDSIPDGDYGAVIYQFPDYYGEIRNYDVKEDKKKLRVVCANPMSLVALEPPVCDVMVGELQPFGNPLSFGGPYAGFMACKDSLKRQLPGRIVGRTVDMDGNQAFCLTLQTREQHIRREKATSNICSNQALTALRSTVYLTVMGKNGVRQVSYLSAKNAHLLANLLSQKGYKVLNKDFFNEFTIEVDNANDFLKKLKQNNILGGIPCGNNKVIIALTEMNSQSDIEKYASAV